MRCVPYITFDGSDLDRAAFLRRNTAALSHALAQGAGVIPFWRGKPLFDISRTGQQMRLTRLPADHPLFMGATDHPIFLGRCDGHLIFAQDISAWSPPNPPAMQDMGQGPLLKTAEQTHPNAPQNTAFYDLRDVMTRLDARDAELAATARSLVLWHKDHRFCARCGAESTMAEAGWQRLCPVCAARHFPRTDPVVIMLITLGDCTLLGRSPDWPQGMFSLLAGYVEPGETIEAAVRREVWEETGITIGTVSYLANQPWPYPSSLMIGCHGCAISKDITVDPEEIEDARWVTRSEMVDIFAGTHPNITPPRAGAIAGALLRHWLAGWVD